MRQGGVIGGRNKGRNQGASCVRALTRVGQAVGKSPDRITEDIHVRWTGEDRVVFDYPLNYVTDALGPPAPLVPF